MILTGWFEITQFKTGSLETPPGLTLFFRNFLLHRWIPLEVHFLMIQGRVDRF